MIFHESKFNVDFTWKDDIFNHCYATQALKFPDNGGRRKFIYNIVTELRKTKNLW